MFAHYDHRVIDTRTPTERSCGGVEGVSRVPPPAERGGGRGRGRARSPVAAIRAPVITCRTRGPIGPIDRYECKGVLSCPRTLDDSWESLGYSGGVPASHTSTDSSISSTGPGTSASCCCQLWTTQTFSISTTVTGFRNRSLLLSRIAGHF